MDFTTLNLRAGLKKHQSGDIAGAERIYRSILDESPDHAGAWHLLGLVSFAKRQFQQAKMEIQKALAVCDTKAVYWNNYGAVLRELRLPEEGKAACERALQIGPRYPDALSNLALCLRDLGSPDLAYSRFRQALEIQPDHGDALKHLAAVCRILGRTDEATTYYRQMLELSPRSAEAWGGLGEVYLACKRATDAVEAFRRAIAIEPQNARLRVSLGNALHLQGEPDQAKVSFAEAARLTGDRPSWRFRNLGYMPQVFRDQGGVDRHFEDLDRQLDSALAVGFDFDWRECLQDGFCPPFGLMPLRKATTP